MNIPRVTLDGAGVRLEFDGKDGKVHSYPLTAEAALELAALLSAKLAELRSSPELQGKIGAAVVKTLFSVLNKNR